jgi:hypothetical protein
MDSQSKENVRPAVFHDFEPFGQSGAAGGVQILRVSSGKLRLSQVL